MGSGRSEIQQEVAAALVESKAIDFEKIGSVLANFGARAALAGSDLGVVLGFHIMDLCIPVERVIVAGEQFRNVANRVALHE